MKQFTLLEGVELTTNEKGAFKDISKLRGSLNPKTKVDVDEVYERAGRLVTLIRQLLPQIEHVLIKTPDELERVWEEIKAAGIVALDTESDVVGSNPNPFLDKLVGVSVYTGGDKAYYIPIAHHFYMSNLDAKGFINKIIEESYKKLKVIMHNAKYDAQVFYVYTQRTIKMYADTMIASRLLNENERAWGEDNGRYDAGHGLKYLWNKYCMNFQYSGDSYSDIFAGRKYGTFNPEKVYVYASLDAVMTLMLWRFQEQYIDSRYKGCKDLGLESVSQLFFRVEMPVLQYATAMEIRGIGFNSELNKELQHRYEKNILESRNSLIGKIQPMIDGAKYEISPARFEKLSRPINLSSDTQLEILFYDILKLRLSEPVQKQILRKKKKAQKNKDNAVNPNSVGKEAMAYFIQAYPDHAPLIKELLAYKELEKIYTAFIIGLRDKVNPKTGRIHAGWNTVGTDTGRFSSKSPNLQQIPSRNGDIRPTIIPEKGNVFVGNDYSAQEPRILAFLSQDPVLLNAFHKDLDVYSTLIGTARNMPYEEVTKDAYSRNVAAWEANGKVGPKPINYRNQGKVLQLALSYGLGEGSLAESIEITAEEASQLMADFKQNLKAVFDFETQLKDFARKNGYVTTILGRRRRFPNYALPELEIRGASGQPVDQITIAKINQEFSKVWKFNERRELVNRLGATYNVHITDNKDKRNKDTTQILNSVIQGSAADMTKLAMVYMFNDEKFTTRGWHIALLVHDELIMEVPAEDAEEAQAFIEEKMLLAATTMCPTVPFKADAEVMEYWVKGD